MRSSESTFELVQVKVRINSRLRDVIVFIPSKVSNASLCQCVAKVASQAVTRISLNGINIERENVVLKDGDVVEIAVEASPQQGSGQLFSTDTFSRNVNLSAFHAKLSQERITPKSDLDFVVLYIHFLMTSCQWACIVEDGQSALKGFAAPKRPLVKKWIFEAYMASDKSKIMYRYKPPTSHQLTVSCSYSSGSNDTISVTFSGERTATRNFSISLSQIKNTSDGTIVEDALYNNFLELLKSYERNFGETLGPSNLTNPSAAPFSEPTVKAQSLQDMMLPPSQQNSSSRSPRLEHDINQQLKPPFAQQPLRSPLQFDPYPNAGNIGGRDMHPYPDLLIGPNSGHFNPYPGGGGSLVGPDHPIFGGGGGSFGSFGSGGLPVPRFDPFGPVTGPHGPNSGNPGAPPMFLPPGFAPPARGPLPSGMGKKPGQRPGEPNPDHLKPPDDQNDSAFG